MLSDFLTLEVFFGHEASALWFEDLARRYGPQSILEALARGDLQCRKVVLGPDAGRHLYWLSEQGRRKATLLE